ncbi:MAG: glycosyltransferase family 25 protein [Phyllobacteriaceae bacterium]|nr:glycosyltransferase family 25 protein [Phyllobacteriaceae bacterium]
MRHGEIAAFLSHREAWRRIAESEADAALVVEDDVDIESVMFLKALRLALAHTGPEHFVRFPVCGRDWRGPVLARAGDVTLFRSRMTGRGAQAQLIGRRAALRLLERSESFDRPVDELFTLPWISGVNTLTVWPNGCGNCRKSWKEA